MFLLNKYNTWYFSIIENAKIQKRSKTDDIYYETHHIIPRSLNTSLDKDPKNLVLLTAKEHFICHLILCKITTGKNRHKMINALIRMQFSKSKNQKRYTSNSYTLIRKLMAEKNSEKFKGIPKTETHKKKISNSHIGKKMGETFSKNRSAINKMMWEAGVFNNRPNHSQKTKEKIRSSLLGKTLKDETKTKISNSNKGRIVSQETRLKISKANKNKSMSLEAREKISNSLKNNKIRLDYENNYKTCPICNSKIVFEKRNNLTCSRSCSKILYHKKEI